VCGLRILAKKNSFHANFAPLPARSMMAGIVVAQVVETDVTSPTAGSLVSVIVIRAKLQLTNFELPRQEKLVGECDPKSELRPGRRTCRTPSRNQHSKVAAEIWLSGQHHRSDQTLSPKGRADWDSMAIRHRRSRATEMIPQLIRSSIRCVTAFLTTSMLELTGIPAIPYFPYSA